MRKNTIIFRPEKSCFFLYSKKFYSKKILENVPCRVSMLTFLNIAEVKYQK